MAGLAVLVLVLAGCGDDDEGAAPSGETGSTDGSKVVDVGAMKGAEGDIEKALETF
jgi:hypothetical protein